MLEIRLNDLVSPMLKSMIMNMPREVVKTLNYLAYDSRDSFIKSQLPDKFTLRKAWWKPGNQFGFNVQKATTANMTATIYTAAPWMSLHELGGNKLPRLEHIALPTEQVRRTKRDLIMKSQRPMALKKAFFLNTDDGGEVLAMNFGRGKNRITKVMYTLRHKTHVWPRLRFKKYIEQYVLANAESKLLRILDTLAR